MYIDFTNLNKACPKDCFLLPRIDTLIDATAEKKRFSFLDAFSGYHQISLVPEDVEKTSFITDFGTFCYTAMPFGLKNAGATYQRMVNRVFGNIVGRTIEAYVDDMVVYSNHEEDHVENLRKIFRVARRSRLKFNPEKCTFDTIGGKFLGFMPSCITLIEVGKIGELPTWMDALKSYLAEGIQPSDPVEARRLRVRIVWFIIIDNHLFKKRISMQYLKCIDANRGFVILTEVHSGMYRNHQGVNRLVFKDDYEIR
ncbi:Transposon Ty3-I Gag-Pol polyprotein [Abeliophyllum distichum]|uniref:Transposon Ty3-I Gag-Pol polyprotein n=1 Tax=Abeliophyllum distichum TaxID=126358 RepID=A0ABD1TY59_9LAMI